jgi:hypothetical protein
MILLAGGARDPNIACLWRRLAARAIPARLVVTGSDRCPRLTWSLFDDTLLLDGTLILPDAVFIRFDVFGELAGGGEPSRTRAASWYYTVLSWALAHDDVRLPNRRFATSHVAKPYVLHLARQEGLRSVETVITNDLARLDGLDADAWILKPVDGGALTATLRQACSEPRTLERLAAEPAFLQRLLVAPDRRIFRVGATWHAFDITSDRVDYRGAKEVALAPAEAEPELVGPLGRLMDRLGLEFGAADFKRCPETGRFAFLEVNSAPMFQAFDARVQGRLADAIIDWLHPPKG